MINKERAIELLGEKKVLHKEEMSNWQGDENRESKGYNKMHSKAVEVVVELLKRIAKMEKESNYQIF